MVEATKKYRAAMDRPDRYGGYARVEFDAIDPGAAAALGGRSDNGHVFYSVLEGIEYDNVPQRTYATFEPGRWVCGQRQQVPSQERPFYQGFVGSILSNAAGIYEQRPVHSWVFDSRRSFRALTVTFDPSAGDWPAKVRAVGYRDGEAVLEVTGEPDGAVYELIPEQQTRFENIDALDLFYLEAGKPYRRPRLQRVLFGYTKTVETTDITGERIEEIVCTAESDPLSRELPRQDVSISMIDHEGQYDMDNPMGIYEDMESHIPVRVYFGALIDQGSTWAEVLENYDWQQMRDRTWQEIHRGGYYEVLLHGSYWLDGQPKTSGYSAQFSAVSVVGLLGSDFKRWPAGGGNLYDLATAVLQSVELPRQRDGGPLWHLWEGLKDIHTTAPMEIKPCNEILQDIAVAARCAIFFDRRGAMHMEPLDTSKEEAMWLDFEGKQVELPSGEGIPPLGGVTASVFTYKPEDRKVLHEETHEVAAGETVEIPLSNPAANVTVETSGKAEIWSGVVFVTFEKAGSYDILITGEELEEYETVLALPVEDARPASEWAAVQNRLIMNAGQARACGQWFMDHLLKRQSYNVSTVGFPEVDVLDKVYSQSRYSEKLPAYILGHTLRFNHAFWSDFLVKVDNEK